MAQRMDKVKGELFLKWGLFFGRLVVKLLEKIIPALRNKDENLYGFNNHYLKKFNLSKKERFKREFKEGLSLIIAIVFWAYMLALLNFIFFAFDLKFHITLFIGIFIFFVLFTLSYAYELHNEIMHK